MKKQDLYAWCKTLGHSWDPIAATHAPSFGTPMHCSCDRCGTVRKDIVSPHDGAILRRNYIYQPGYRDAERLTKAELRLRMARSWSRYSRHTSRRAS